MGKDGKDLVLPAGRGTPELPTNIRKLVTRITGARLCYGEPVRSGDRTVIPVAAVRAAGGGGFGREGEEASGEQQGGGGGGALRAQPVGFIEISSEGTRFERIVDPSMVARAIVGAAAAGAAVATLLARRA